MLLFIPSSANGISKFDSLIGLGGRVGFRNNVAKEVI
jgi:hypothetical protein